MSLIPRPPVNRGPRQGQYTTSPPIGGWNVFDAIDAMPQQDALDLINFFPDVGRVALRRGFVGHAVTGLGGAPVDTLATFADGSGEKFLAGANGNVYDVSSSTPVSLKSGFTSDIWSYTNFDGKLGLVNGEDAPQVYDGSTLADMTVSGTGLTVSNLVGVTGHRSRTYFWEKNSQDFWYSATNTLGGALTRFPLSRAGNLGGRVVAIDSAVTGGESADFAGGGLAEDLLCIYMSRGEVVVYQGSDPGADFALVGVYPVSPLVSERTVVKIGDDLALGTLDGAVPFAGLLQTGRKAQDLALTRKIQGAWKEATREFANNPGWAVCWYPRSSMVLWNIPLDATATQQYVQNTATGAWCRFTDMNARSLAVWQERLYFGTPDGRIFLADVGTTDNGQPIQGEVRSAFTRLQRGGLMSQISAVRPLLEGTGEVAFGLAVEADYEARLATPGEVAFGIPSPNWENIDVDWDLWDENWDADQRNVFSQWLIRSARGGRFSLRVEVETDEEFAWLGTDFRFEAGTGI